MKKPIKDSLSIIRNDRQYQISQEKARGLKRRINELKQLEGKEPVIVREMQIASCQALLDDIQSDIETYQQTQRH